jgi:hypothetical protein
MVKTKKSIKKRGKQTKSKIVDKRSNHQNEKIPQKTNQMISKNGYKEKQTSKRKINHNGGK